MADQRITVRDIPQDLVKQLDKIVCDENYSSRSQLIVEILSRYAKLKDRMYLDAVTPVIRCIIKDEIKQLSKMSKYTMEVVEKSSLKILKTSQQLNFYMGKDFWDKE